MKTKYEDERIKQLFNHNKKLDKLIKAFPENAKNHYYKAGNLLELAVLTKNQSFYIESLISYSAAINFNPEEGLYYIDRSKLYIILEYYDLAFLDILQIKKISKKVIASQEVRRVPLEEIKYYCLEEAATKIAKNNGIKAAVKKLVIENKVLLNDIVEFFPDVFASITEDISTNRSALGNIPTDKYMPHVSVLGNNKSCDENVGEYENDILDPSIIFSDIRSSL